MGSKGRKWVQIDNQTFSHKCVLGDESGSYFKLLTKKVAVNGKIMLLHFLSCRYPIFSFGCNCDGSNLSLFPCNLNLGVGRGMLLCPYLHWSELWISILGTWLHVFLDARIVWAMEFVWSGVVNSDAFGAK